ncbi:MAG TPA: carboxylesterase family protein [Candidatus Binatia bacterium]|nr:carboxylesterase family protein [Candidatus Binatia bacterium]
MRCGTALGLLAVLVLGCRGGAGTYHLAPAPATLRHPPAGDVVGGEGRYGSYAWLGIPYAKPPTGRRRWRAPEPAERFAGLREALAFGAPCVQYGSRLGGAPGVPPGRVGGDEDCLTLNVWAPRDATPASRLPVLVWIHGGGNTIGHAGLYDGGHLAAAEHLVVVTAQYRLGPFGWFAHPALRADAADDAERSGNFGTLDLVRALAWVRDDVAAFGGDPGNVTIAGESAGGLDVYTLLLAPQARGLFHRAIVESGGLWLDTAAVAEREHPQASREIVLRLLERSGRARDRADAEARLAAMRDDEIAAFLRAEPAREVLAAYFPWPTGMIDMPRAIADGRVLPADPLAALGSDGGWNRVPVLVGTNRDENKLFMYFDPRWVRKILWLVPRFVDEPRYEATAEYMARMWKAASADAPATAMSRVEPSVFVYRFDWHDEPTILGADLSKMLGAAHALEIPFVFGHFDMGTEGNRLFTPANEPGRLALSRAMMSYWAAFARDGAPGRGTRGDLPAWDPWGDGRFLVLDTDGGGGIRMTSGAETRAGVLAALDHDPRLASPAHRCGAYREIAEFGRWLSREEYLRAGCADFPR